MTRQCDRAETTPRFYRGATVRLFLEAVGTTLEQIEDYPEPTAELKQLDPLGGNQATPVGAMTFEPIEETADRGAGWYVRLAASITATLPAGPYQFSVVLAYDDAEADVLPPLRFELHD